MTAEPDGWMVAHHRATDVLHFGPFSSVESARLWLGDHPDVRGVLVPLYLDVDWRRAG